MARAGNRLLAERPLPRDGKERQTEGLKVGKPRLSRSVTVNLVESPLGWLKARGLVSDRQFDAGERLRHDWERAQLAPSVTMRWDAPPTARVARGAPDLPDATCVQLAAKLRFEAAVAEAGPGLGDILWRIVCAGEGMRDAEQALGWPARAGRLVLGMALDRVADFYRIS
ncbi:MAG TPA: DUF6456 domain-containing protein [Allosphingosinicella sp.]|uniref:DUF6456 domain-containing protein n=1 Tax=Allosphingosinicella sp. TaxID=2823234 RepID=UPI002EDAAC30